MLFKNRREAGEKLSAELESYKGLNPLILAVPRGGVTVAEPVWENVGGELDLIITRKIGAPYQPELAIGAVSGDGFIMLNNNIVSRLNVTEDYINRAAESEQDEIRRRLRIYRGNRSMPLLDNRLVVIIDDGVATGYTLLAAIRSLQEKTPAKLVLAIPVGPPDTLAMLEKEVDDLIFLEAPVHFSAVGQFYRQFDQVSDSEVIAILQKAWKGKNKDL